MFVREAELSFQNCITRQRVHLGQKVWFIEFISVPSKEANLYTEMYYRFGEGNIARYNHNDEHVHT